MDLQHPVLVRRVNNRLQAMASQVKEVLPHVPMATIISDLGILLFDSTRVLFRHNYY